MSHLTTEASRGLLTRSRVHHMENNEKCTRYFFRKLARPRNVMDAIKDKNGKEQTDINDILASKRAPLNIPHAETRPPLYGRAVTLFKKAVLNKSSVDFVNR
ncbi:hypothetical protein F7725_008702, partial [Dissostichus mawsoni]